MKEEHVFDDLDALRQAGAKQGRTRKSRKVAAKAKAKAKDGHYVQMTEQEAVAGFQALGCRAALVWFELLFLSWKDKSVTVVLSNQRLARMGVTRWTKNRALIRLAKAKLIHVVQIGDKSPRVTLIRQ
jgi:hypothetical protein